MTKQTESMINTRCIIERIELFKAPLRLREPFVTSLGANESAYNIYLRIITDKGITGYGECCPTTSIHGETTDAACLVGRDLAKGLLGKDACDIEACNNILDSIIYGNSGIKSAFDIGIHDIAARAAGLPLYEFLGGKNDKVITTDYTVSVGSSKKMVSDAVRIKEKGFPVIKVKLGNLSGEDAERIRSIRIAVGMDIPLRIDANQGWDPEYALQVLRKIAGQNIQFCEEPIPRWQFMELPELRKNSPVAIMADESCFDHHDAQRLIHLDACDSINLKLGKSGIYKTRKIIELAEESGLEMQVGGMLGSRVAFSATAPVAQ
jgi:L-alanine-DL-glutamate epimerase-like enolase superfamily enzyme